MSTYHSLKAGIRVPPEGTIEKQKMRSLIIFGQKRLALLPLFISVLLLIGCQSLPDSNISFDAAGLQFSGEQALALEETFVTQFPNRASGMPNVALGTRWLQQQFESYGLSCATDEWQATLYSKPVPMKNIVCSLPGSTDHEIVLLAHHDQSPQTIYGADNDGSGIAILLHLAQLFAREPRPPYTLVFLATDGEEWGMLGSRRYVQQHPHLERIIAAVSLDNLGKYFYDGLEMSPIGQYNGYGPAWLLQAARDSAAAAAAAGDTTIRVPTIRPPFDQVVNQAVPISFMDQGPFVAGGVPAFGLANLKPSEFDDLHFTTFHTPGDTLELQSADSLQAAGRATEALVRQLQTMDTFPRSSVPYLYFADSDTIFQGPLLWLIFALFVSLFFVASIWTGRRSSDGLIAGWQAALPHFLAIWLPLLLAILSLYLMTAAGLLPQFSGYFATQKEPVIYHPHWPAVTSFLLSLTFFLWAGRKWAARLSTTQPDYRSIKSLSLLIVGLATLYAAIFNPFSLLLAGPLLFWLLIKGRRGLAYMLDILCFALGLSLLIYFFYVFGFNVLRIDWLILWYVMMMIAVPMVGFFTMAVILAIIGAGFAMVVHPPLSNVEVVKSPPQVAPVD
jgi:hypothetical protein